MARWWPRGAFTCSFKMCCLEVEVAKPLMHTSLFSTPPPLSLSLLPLPPSLSLSSTPSPLPPLSSTPPPLSHTRIYVDAFRCRTILQYVYRMMYIPGIQPQQSSIHTTGGESECGKFALDGAPVKLLHHQGPRHDPLLVLLLLLFLSCRDRCHCWC